MSADRPRSLAHRRRAGPDRRLHAVPLPAARCDSQEPALLPRDDPPDLVRRRDEPGHHHHLRPVRRHGARPAAVLRAVDLRRHRRARHGGVAGALPRAGAGGDRAAVRRPRRNLDHRRDRPDARHRPAVGDGDDGGRSARLRGHAALPRRHRRHAAARLRVQRAGHLRRAPRRRDLARPGQRHVLVEHDLQRRRLEGRDQRRLEEHRVRRRGRADRGVPGLHHARRPARAWPTRRRGRWCSPRSSCSRSISS